MEKEGRDFKKHLHTFDRKFSAASLDLINIRVNTLDTELEAPKQQLTNTPNTPTSPSIGNRTGTQIHLRLTEQDARIDELDSDHQLIIDSLDTLHTKITDGSNKPAAHPVPLTNLNALIFHTQEDTTNIDRCVTVLCAREKEFQKSTLARITTSLVDFGQLARETEQLVATVNPTEQTRL